MPTEWYLMNRPLYNSGFEDDEFWAFGQDGFQEVLDSFLGSDVLVYDKCLSKKPQQIRAVIQQVTSDVFNSTTVRQILCNIGILKCGQYIKIGDGYWMVSSLPDNNCVYEKAVLWKCKYTLRFISPLTGEVVEYPIYDTNSTQYGTGESEKERMSVGDAQHLVYIPYNEETILIDDRFRFLMDKNTQNPTAYRVTQVDPISYSVGSENEDGLIQWSIIETQFNGQTDNKELMIADYYTQNVEESQSTTDGEFVLTLTDLDGDSNLAIGEEKEIILTCANVSGEDIADFSCNVFLEPDDGTVEIVRRDGNALILAAKKDRSLVGKSVIVRAVSNSLQSEAFLTIRIVNW